MTDKEQFVFNGEPPASYSGHSTLARFRDALDQRPGEWGQLPSETVSKAGSRSQWLRQKGYEATQRKELVYARKPLA